MKVAALDLGTNSFLCLIAAVENGEIKNVLSDQVQIVRLGQDVNKTKKFHPDALKRARLCLYEFKKAIDQHKPEKILAMATSAARDVSNANELFKLGKDLGIPIEIIPGDREAEITFKGAISNLPRDKKRRAVIDIGGGSTEIIAGTHDEIFFGRSVNIGAVRMTELFLPNQPPTSEQFQALQKNVDEKLRALLEIIGRYQVDELIAVAGTPTELAAATSGEFDPAKIEGFRFSQEALIEWIENFKLTTVEERIDKLGISKGRADIILAGTVILEMILRGLDFNLSRSQPEGFDMALLWKLKNDSQRNKTQIIHRLPRGLATFLLAGILAVPIWSRAEPHFEKRKLKIGNKTLSVEIADNNERSAYGLMYRKTLPEGTGMLFIFPDEQPRAFWMKNTFVPLSIGYFDSKKELIDIQDMEPAQSEVQNQFPNYPSKGPAQYALEVPKGWFLKNKVKIGQKFSIP